MRKLVGKIMQYLIGYGLSLQGMEDTSCHYPPDSAS